MRRPVRPAATAILALAALMISTGAMVPRPAAAQGEAPSGGPPPPSEVLAQASQQPKEPLVQRTHEEISQLYLKQQSKFMSPYCPGLVLRDCTSSGAAALREQFRAWLTEGHSEAWIATTMIATYGETILAAPPFRGAAIVVWLAPGIALLIGAVLLVRFLQGQWKRQRELDAANVSAPRRPALDPELERRLEQEVQARLR
jgi:cytochrome c-type biogenesis protein CcmH/NrfF